MDKITIEGKCVKIIFRSKNDFYIVAVFKTNDGDRKQIRVVGYFQKIEEGNMFSITGEYQKHQKYGLQFKVDSYQPILADSEQGIISYLSGPRFRGIGKKTAERLVNELGKDIFKKIADNNQILDSLDYLSSEKKNTLIQGVNNLSDDQEKTYLFLASHNLTSKQVITIQNLYKEQTISKLEEDPYRLVREVKGIDFNTADKFGESLKIELNDIRRLTAYGYSLLNTLTMKEGDSYVEEEMFKQTFINYFFGLDFDYDQVIEQLQQQALLKIEEDRYYPFEQYKSENTIANYLANFPSNPLVKVDEMKIEEMIQQSEKLNDFKYADEQIEAIRTFFMNDLTILTGGPGTGKTTIVKAIIELIHQLYPQASVALCAPTGRASKRLKELTKYEAKTIHSLLKFDLDTASFGMNGDNPILNDILIVDEFSMVDQYVFSRLLEAGGQFRKILLIGDENQLPSVGPGKVLSDLLETDLFTCVRLKKIFRQKKGSGIIELAHEVADNSFKSFFGQDVNFIETDEFSIWKNVKDEYAKALEKGYPLTDVQVLAPIYAGAAGIDILNSSIQDACNPAKPKIPELRVGNHVFRINDKILQLKNQPDDNVFNGDIGVLTNISFAADNSRNQNLITVNYDGINVEYGPEDYDKITHAFCVSVHKAQGSEYPVVIMAICNSYGKILQKRLIYTAITRAEKNLILIGEKNAFIKGINSPDQHQRKTTLVRRLKNLM